MPDQVLASLLVYACTGIFFLVLPLIGALGERTHWKHLREDLYGACDAPLHDPSDPDFRPAEDSLVRLYGILDSCEGQDHVWMRTGSTSIRVRLQGETIHFLPKQEGDNPRAWGTSSMESRKWAQAGIMAEGVGMCVLGCYSRDQSLPLVRHIPGRPFLVIFYDGLPRHILGRAVWSARSRNEFWNTLTPPSFLLGTGLLFILALVLLRTGMFVSGAIWAMAFGFLPYLALMPPGILGYLAYRRLWRTARQDEACKDLLVLARRMEASPVLRRNCGYRVSQVLPGGMEEAHVRSRDDVVRVSFGPASVQGHPGLSAWYHPAWGTDPGGEAWCFSGMSPSLLPELHRRIRTRIILSLACFLSGLLVNFVIVVFLLVQIVRLM